MKQIILMADIVESHVYPQQALMLAFKDLVLEANTYFRDDLLSPLTITLGDEFQGIIKDVASALRIIVFLEEKRIQDSMHYELRYVLHEGMVETPINPHIAFGMLGPGLTHARQALNQMKSETHRFQILLENIHLNALLNAAFVIFESIRSEWNLERDAGLIAAFLENSDYKWVAKKRNKDRSLMWKRAKNLRIDSYYAVKRIFETALLLSE
jgi:hypothetical protein